ncbi:MAG: hypothetical protein KJ058_03145 [Thermoanaerobaculia bacterium]|nr:hypothetical protein [Thermoanaerobaculia bacterium]MCZ7649892.1 hypothetical protein [Thermoanaerobaculia bacterium]
MASTDDSSWQSASWAGAAEATLRAGARLTMAERLAWLEEAAEVARRLGEARQQAGLTAAPGTLDPTDSSRR